MKRKTAWKWWSKALGEKPSKCDRESDKIAIIRTVIFATYLITNCFIVAGVIRHWNDNQSIEIYIDNTPHEVPGNLHQKQEEIGIKTSSNFL